MNPNIYTNIEAHILRSNMNSIHERGTIGYIEDIAQSDASNCVDNKRNIVEGVAITSHKGEGASTEVHNTVGIISGHWCTTITQIGYYGSSNSGWLN